MWVSRHYLLWDCALLCTSIERFSLDCRKGLVFGFGFTTPFGWLGYLLWFWFYDSQVKTALVKTRKTFACLQQRPLVKRSSKPWSKLDFVEIFGPIKRNQPIHSLLDGMMEILSFESVELWYPMVWQFKSNLFGMQFFHLLLSAF